MPRKIVSNAEEFIWANFKFYLLTYQSCLFDLICPIKDIKATNPVDRYEDVLNFFDAHIGLGSYVTGQATQFNKTPYITMNIATIPSDKCSVTCVIGFDVVYATDTPPAPDNQTQYVGSSSESVAAFRADMMTALDQLFYYAFGNPELDENGNEIQPNTYYTQSFFDKLRNQQVKNPTNPDDTKFWEYNIVGDVSDDSTISEVSQLKREDRSTQLNVFHLVYKIDISNLYGNGVDCGC